MRLKNLIIGDIRFQWKYGFYFIYVVIIVLYACILSLLPTQARRTVGIIMVYSDPAAMGMFFMGAIVLLEKSERILNSIAISPVTPKEYICAKVVSIGIISTIVGVIISLFGSGCSIWIVLGVFLGSVLFTLCGLIVGANIKSLNQYVIATVPFELIGFVPPIAYILGYQNQLMLLHPGCAIIKLMTGMSDYWILMIAVIVFWIGILFLMADKAITKMFRQVGGVKI